MATDAMCRFACPLLVMVAVIGLLSRPTGSSSKPMLGGLLSMPGISTVPVIETACWLPALPPESSVKVRVALCAAVEVGENLMSTVQ